MSSLTWTPAALRSEARAFAATFWRAVETQYENSTRKLVESDAEQALLEEILEASKPPLPPECAGFDYLYFTPFRYIPHAVPARFRGPVEHGLLYTAEAKETTLYEMLWHRLAFFHTSPDTPLPDNPLSFTVFNVPIQSDQGLDLSDDAFAAARPSLLDPGSYGHSQAFGDLAREAGCALILYPSVRDPQRRLNAALLEPSALAAKTPSNKESWQLYLGRQEARMARLFGGAKTIVPLATWTRGMAQP